MQNLNAIIWSSGSKSTIHWSKIVQIASYTVVTTLKDGYTSVLYIMQLLNLEIDPYLLKFSEKFDS